MERLLTTLGYRPLATVEKVRTEYRRGAVTLCLDRVAGGEYRLTAWCDKPENEGGRIRVILAR